MTIDLVMGRELTKFWNELINCGCESYHERRNLLLPAFKFSIMFFSIYYIGILYPLYGLSSPLFLIDFYGGTFVLVGFVLSLFLSKRFTSNPILALPSLGAVIAGLFFLSDPIFLKAKPHMWVYPLIIGGVFASGVASLRCNVIIGSLNVFLPMIFCAYSDHVEVRNILENGAIVYFATFIGIMFSYKKTIDSKKLIKQKNKIQWLKETSDLGSWDWDLRTNQVNYDKIYCKILGYKTEEVKQDFSFWETHTHPEDKEKTLRLIDQYFKGEISNFKTMFRMRHKNGHWVHIFSQGAIFERDSKGNAIYFNGSHLDISHLVEIEEQNDKLTKLTETIQDIIRIGGWEVNVVTGEAFLTKGIYNILEISECKKITINEVVQLFPLSEQVKFNFALNSCMERGTPFDEHFYYTNLSGSVSILRLIGKPSRNQDGEVPKVFGVFMDVTEKVKKEEALTNALGKIEKNLDYVNLIFSNAPAPILTCNEDGLITRANPASTTILGCPHEELINIKNISMIFGKDDLVSKKLIEEGEVDITPHEISKRIFKFLLNVEQQNNIEWGLINIKGVTIPSFVSIRLLRDQDDNTLSYLIIIHDLTGQKILNQTSKLATLGEMAAGVAHEINNPLAIISGHTDLICKNLDNVEKVGASAEKIQKSINRINSIVSGLKKFSRTQNGTQKRKVEIHKVLAEVEDLMQIKAKERGVPLKFLCPDEIIIMGDEVQIEQILINLIGNSIDAIQGIIEPWVKVSVALENSMVKIMVQDCGKGISDKIVDKIFNPFFTLKDVGKGTGLGLSISLGLAKEHGGSLDYKLINGHTAFILTLPLLASHNETQNVA